MDLFGCVWCTTVMAWGSIGHALAFFALAAASNGYAGPV
jgi:hypothetical protein